ncbi:hypothetical protein AVEN_264005-1, partial [Araneus ventricosus]
AWNNSEQAPQWEVDEPIHECVALNISSGHLVTQKCDTELEYVCQNFGFPVYPISKSLACPKEWLLFYQLPVGNLHCIKLFAGPANGPGVLNETSTCLELGSRVANLQDFQDLYFNMSQLNISGYGLIDPGSDCETTRIESVFGDNMKENHTCLDKIFICERNRRRICK